MAMLAYSFYISTEKHGKLLTIEPDSILIKPYLAKPLSRVEMEFSCRITKSARRMCQKADSSCVFCVFRVILKGGSRFAQEAVTD